MKRIATLALAALALAACTGTDASPAPAVTTHTSVAPVDPACHTNACDHQRSINGAADVFNHAR